MILLRIALLATLTLSVVLNTLFLNDYLSWVAGAAWAIAELAVFVIPRNFLSIIIKSTVQVLSFAMTFLFISSFVQQADTQVQDVTRSVASYQQQVDEIDVRLEVITLNGYTSTDPAYHTKKIALETRLHQYKNTSYKYYGKARPESFWEVTNNCNPNGPVSAKVTKDYASTCRGITRIEGEIELLDNTYNSESVEADEVRTLKAKRVQLYEDWPKLGQNNIKGLTSKILASFGLSDDDDMLLIFLVFGLCLVVTSTNLYFSLRGTEMPRFANNWRGLGSPVPMGQMKIPNGLGVNTEPGNKFHQVLENVMSERCDGCVVNKPYVQHITPCSNNIAQAVINTLSYNHLIKKDGNQWMWVDVQ